MRANKIRDLLADGYYEDEDVFVEIEELERLAKIGKAFESAKEKEFSMFWYTEYSGGRTKKFPISEEEYESVLSWYESEEIDDGV